MLRKRNANLITVFFPLQIHYDYLIVALGLQLAFNKVRILIEFINDLIINLFLYNLHFY